jgi:hypothetical protein
MIRPELFLVFHTVPVVDERLIEEAWMRSHIASLVWANRCMPQSTEMKRGITEMNEDRLRKEKT